MNASKPRHNDRRCVATGEPLPPGATTLRFVLDPNGVLTLDLSGKLPGRGAWLTADTDHLLTALKKGGFSRSFKDTVNLPENLSANDYVDEISHQLLKRTLNQLGLARRVGQCVTGFEVVKSAVPKLLAYITPMDAAPDGVGKITRVLEARGNAPHIVLNVESTVLADAIGMPGSVHLGLIPGKAAKSAFYEASRLGQFVNSDQNSRQ